MDTDFDNTNRGACWPNRNKANDNSPDYRGELDVEGVKYWVSMWLDPGASGTRPPIKFAVHQKDEQPQAPAPGLDPLQDIKDLAAGPDTPQPEKPFDDDIPF